jgi:hypothetical protein
MSVLANRIKCEGCGSEYALQMMRLTFRDKDFLTCEVCGFELKRWNEAKSWSATLIKKGQSEVVNPASKT